MSRADKLRARAYARPAERKRGNSNQFVGKMPVITAQPVTWQGAEGVSILFTITAYSEDGSPLTYQWQERNPQGEGINLVDGGRVTGASTDTLQISGATLADEGRLFRCKVCNANTCVYSVWAGVDVIGVVYFLVSEAGSFMVDEPATSNIVDERSP